MSVKNIVICCDGTMSKYGTKGENTNVVRLFERLVPDGGGQISYYDPGVGTYSSLRTPVGRLIQNGIESVVGYGVKGNVSEAYRYLMNHYGPGDKIFLFGFSRGAHTVRVLAGLIHKCGLLTKGSDNLIPHAVRVYYEKDNDEIATDFRNAFSRECKTHFIGVWDTVASVGWVWRNYFKDRKLNVDVSYGYQALAIDEKRSHFEPSIWDEIAIPEGQVIEQVWFPGFHGDVGGQKACRSISDIPLKWMAEHAETRGLKMRPGWSDDLHPDPGREIKESWKGVWWLTRPRKRTIRESERIHPSARQRQSILGCRYNPTNLPHDTADLA